MARMQQCQTTRGNRKPSVVFRQGRWHEIIFLVRQKRPETKRRLTYVDGSHRIAELTKPDGRFARLHLLLSGMR
jgi:hypothetical protein